MLDYPLFFFFAIIAMGFLVILLIQKTSPKKERIAPENPELKNLSFDEFYQSCCDLLEKLGLVIRESYRENDYEADIICENPTPIIGGLVIVHLMLYPREGKVGTIDVMNFASNLIGERKGKGIIITTGDFAEEIQTLPELPPMDFINGKRLVGLWQEHKIKAPKLEGVS